MEENKFDFRFLNKIMYLVAIAAFFGLLKVFGLTEKIWDVLMSLTPALVGIVICWISKPIANRLRKWGLSKGLSATIALIIIFAIMIIALSYIIPIIVTQVTQFVKDLPSLYSNSVIKINLFLTEKFGINYQLPTSIKDLGFLSDMVPDILSYSLTTVQSVVSFFISAITAIMVSFFMVKDMDRSKNSLIVLLSKNGKDANKYKMLTEMDEVINSYVRGLIIDSVIVGIMITIVCIVLKLKYAVIFGIIITILNLIPYIGAAISYTITSLYAFTVGGPVLAVITFVASFIVQLIDANILQPNIIGKSVHLHPVVVICGLLVFEAMFGIVGMIIAMPVLAIGKIYIKYKFGINFENQDVIEKTSKTKKVKKA